MLNYKKFICFAFIPSIWAQPMDQGRGQGVWQQSHDGRHQSRILSSTSSQHPQESFSYFSNPSQPHSSRVPLASPHQSELQYGLFSNSYQPYTPQHNPNIGVISPYVPAEPHVSLFQHELPQGTHHLPYYQRQHQDQNYPHAQLSQPLYGHVNYDPRLAPQNYQYPIDQFHHVSMTDQRTGEVGPTFSPATSYGATSSHIHGAPSTAGSPSEGSLIEIPPMQATGRRQEKASAKFVREASNSWYQIWKARVPNPAQYTFEGLVDQVARIEASTGKKNTPLKGVYYFLMRGWPQGKRQSFLNRLCLLRGLYDSVIQSRGIDQQQASPLPSRRERENAMEEAISLLNLYNGEPISYYSRNEREKASRIVTDVKKIMNLVKKTVGTNFKKYLSELRTPRLLRDLSKRQLEFEVKRFTRITPPPTFPSGQQMFSGRGEFIRTLLEYVKEVRVVYGPTTPSLDSFAYLLDHNWYPDDSSQEEEEEEED